MQLSQDDFSRAYHNLSLGEDEQYQPDLHELQYEAEYYHTHSILRLIRLQMYGYFQLVDDK